MSKLKIGDKAPSFQAIANNGREIRLRDFQGQKKIVLYFYPKDDTPGCTKEACGFRDYYKRIYAEEAVILGVSPDSIRKHQGFVAKYDLPFLLLSDEDKTICQDYRVWVEKSMYGKKYMGVARTTFIIDKDGTLIKIFENVKAPGHAEEVYAFLSSLAAEVR